PARLRHIQLALSGPQDVHAVAHEPVEAGEHLAEAPLGVPGHALAVGAPKEEVRAKHHELLRVGALEVALVDAELPEQSGAALAVDGDLHDLTRGRRWRGLLLVSRGLELRLGALAAREA